MRYGIFGDIHSNREAFEKVIDFYRKEEIDKFICVGDIVGYGADPHWCIDEVKKLNIRSVGGNHDFASAGLLDIDYFNYAARCAVEWTKRHLTLEEERFLKSLELVLEYDDFYIVHGSLDKPEKFYYIMDIASAKRCFYNMKKNLCFIGHSHVPVIFYEEAKLVNYTFENHITLRPGLRYIINVGSVGQPRDGNPKAAFSIFDTEKMTVEINRIGYDIKTAKNKILNQGLPGYLGHRLLEGR